MQKKLNDLKNTIKKTVFKSGDYAYLISSAFMKEFEDCAKKNYPITEIDNSSLFKGEYFVPNLVEGKDYFAVNETTWNELCFEFDVKKTAKVKVLDDGRPELYPMNLTVQYGKQTKQMIISKSADISTLVLRILMEFMIPNDQFELWTPGARECVKQEGTVYECLKGCYRVEVKPIERQQAPQKQQIKGIKPLFTTNSTTNANQNKNQNDNNNNQNTNSNSNSSANTTESTQNIESNTTQQPPEIERPKQKPAGLKNLGNTCYMNSSLQCLASIPQFVDELFKIDKTEKKLTKALLQIITSLRTKTNTVIDTESFKSVIDELLPQFYGYGQQDAQEFTSALIDKLNEETPSIGKLFYGNMKSSTICAECKKVSISDEKFSCLSLPVSGFRRVTFVPWSNEEPLIKLFAPPKDKKFFLLAEKDQKFIQVQWPAPEFDELYALEYKEIKPNKAYAIIKVRATGGRVLTCPLIAEVPINEKVAETRLRGLVSTRISDLWHKEFRPQATPNWKIISGPERFKKITQDPNCLLCNEQLQVEIRSGFADPSKGFRDIRTRHLSTTSSVSDLIGAFLECTRLDADNVWKCTCGVSTRAIRQSEVVTAPNILILQLKRFAVGKHSVDRDSTPVIIPKELELCGNKYQLRSISNHAGGIGAGHYTALAERNGFCYNFNDSKVSFSQGFPNESYGAYVLFYSFVD